MEQDDEEFEKLLGEIPRATSAPPQAEGLRRALRPQVDGGSPSRRGEAVRHTDNIRSGVLYEGLYPTYSGAEKLPPHLENRVACNDLVILSPESTSRQISPVYNGFDSPGTDFRQLEMHKKQQAFLQSPQSEQASQQLEMQQKRQVFLRPQQSHQRCQYPSSSISDPFSHSKSQQILCDDQSLASSFLHLNLEDNLGAKPNGNGNIGLKQGFAAGLPNGCATDISSGFFSHVGNVVGTQAAADNSLRNGFHCGYPLSNGFHCGLDELLSVPVEHVAEKFLRHGPTGSDLHSNGRSSSMVAHGRGLPSKFQLQQQQQEASAAALFQKQMEEYRQCMQDQLFLRQQQLQEQQACFYASLQAQPGAMDSTYTGVHFLNRSFQGATLGYLQQQAQQREGEMGEKSWNRGCNSQQSSMSLTAAAIGLLEPAHVSQFGNICDYYSQGFCGRGDFSPLFHMQDQFGRQSKCNLETSDGGFAVPSQEPSYLKNNLPGRNARGGLEVSPSMPLFPGSRRRNDALANGHSNGHSHSDGNLATSQLCHVDRKASLRSNAQEKIHMELSQLTSVQELQLKYTSLEEVEGCIYDIAKDQHGCRFLQRKFEEGSNRDIERIFVEIIHHIIELMTDPFGNYLVQKLLDVCDESQHMEILQKVTGKGRLATISLNMHGTRAVQKVIETLRSLEQVSMVIYSLKEGVVTLIKDLNGNHVVQRCLQCLNTEDNQFIFDAAISHCVDIATHRHGCCVLQRCVDFASRAQRECLVTEIAANALVLSQDPFGNYVVQYILDLAMPWITVEVIDRLEGNFAHLATQKFSSNVVEKCLKLANEENKALISWELMNSSQLGQLLQDPYANYVVQCALANSKGALHARLVEAMKPHLPALRSSPYGKRILSRTAIKK